MKAKSARFDANQTLNIANMAFMNAHSFGHEKIPRLYVPPILSPETQPPKGVKLRAGTRAKQP